MYRAASIRLGEPVAVKILAAEHLADPVRVRRFEREARASFRLHHPNTVRVYDVGRVDEQHLYIVMELLVGQPLAASTERGLRFASGHATSIAAQAARALHEAHLYGLVHRDLKPANLFLTRVRGHGELVKVLDFGAATSVVEPARPGETPRLIGTVSYMAPEQCRGGTVDARTDLYALGVVLWQMLAGRRPFEADDPVTMMHRHLATPPPSLPEAAGGSEPIPEPLRELVRRLLAKDPDGRPGSAIDAARELEELTALPTSAASRLPPTRPEPAGQPDASTAARREPTHREVPATSRSPSTPSTPSSDGSAGLLASTLDASASTGDAIGGGGFEPIVRPSVLRPGQPIPRRRAQPKAPRRTRLRRFVLGLVLELVVGLLVLWLAGFAAGRDVAPRSPERSSETAVGSRAGPSRAGSSTRWRRPRRRARFTCASSRGPSAR